MKQTVDSNTTFTSANDSSATTGYGSPDTLPEALASATFTVSAQSAVSSSSTASAVSLTSTQATSTSVGVQATTTLATLSPSKTIAVVIQAKPTSAASASVSNDSSDDGGAVNDDDDEDSDDDDQVLIVTSDLQRRHVPSVQVLELDTNGSMPIILNGYGNVNKQALLSRQCLQALNWPVQS
jgi:hypothetical protein